MFGLDTYNTGLLLLTIVANTTIVVMAFCWVFEARKRLAAKPEEPAAEDPAWISIDRMYEELKKDGWHR